MSPLNPPLGFSRYVSLRIEYAIHSSSSSSYTLFILIDFSSKPFDLRFIKNLPFFVARRFVSLGGRTGSSTRALFSSAFASRHETATIFRLINRLAYIASRWNGITSEERVASDCVYARARANYSSERALCTSWLPIVHEHPAIRDEVASPPLWSDGFAQV